MRIGYGLAGESAPTWPAVPDESLFGLLALAAVPGLVTWLLRLVRG